MVMTICSMVITDVSEGHSVSILTAEYSPYIHRLKSVSNIQCEIMDLDIIVQNRWLCDNIK